MEEREIVLLVEDEANDVFLMQRAVRKMNVPVSLKIAEDGEEAIAYLSGCGEYSDRHRYPLPCLILLDINMPRKNGFDVLEWLRQDNTLAHIPVAMLTSSKVQTDIDKAFELGARAYLVKPLTAQDLARLLNERDHFLAEHGNQQGVQT